VRGSHTWPRVAPPWPSLSPASIPARSAGSATRRTGVPDRGRRSPSGVWPRGRRTLRVAPPGHRGHAQKGRSARVSPPRNGPTRRRLQFVVPRAATPPRHRGHQNFLVATATPNHPPSGAIPARSAVTATRRTAAPGRGRGSCGWRRTGTTRRFVFVQPLCAAAPRAAGPPRRWERSGPPTPRRGPVYGVPATPSLSIVLAASNRGAFHCQRGQPNCGAWPWPLCAHGVQSIAPPP
jgi:hypothetical protein